MHNKKGASPLPLRLTEVRPSTRMYRNRTWEHTPNGVYPQHPFPDIHLIGRFQLRANSGKYHFKTKIAKSVRFPKKRGHQRQKSCSGRSRRDTGSLHRNAVRGYGGAGCGMRGEGAKELRGADAGVSAGAKVHGVRRVSVQVQVQVQARARGVGRGVRRVPMRGSEKCRCRAQKSVGVSRVQAQVQARGQKDVKGEGGETNRRGAQKSVGTGAGAGADRTGPSGQRLRTRRPRRRARPIV